MSTSLLVVSLLSGCALEEPLDGAKDLFSADSEDEVSACEDAWDHVVACEGGQGESPYRAELAGAGCEDSCVSACIEDASCDDLAEREGAVYDTGYSDCPTFRPGLEACLYECRGGCDTPLALSFDGGPIALGAPDGTFDFGARGRRWVSWPAPANPWLVLDRNGNGTIDDAGELFGDATLLVEGRTARNGFEALAALDVNHDGQVSAADPAWPALALWSDADGDRVSATAELQPLGARGLRALDLDATTVPRCDAWGNCEGERSRFEYVAPDGAVRVGALVDVYLRTSPAPTGS